MSNTVLAYKERREGHVMWLIISWFFEDQFNIKKILTFDQLLDEFLCFRGCTITLFQLQQCNLGRPMERITQIIYQFKWRSSGIPVRSKLFIPLVVALFYSDAVTLTIVAYPLLQHGPPAEDFGCYLQDRIEVVETRYNNCWYEIKVPFFCWLDCYDTPPFSVTAKLVLGQQCRVGCLVDCTSHRRILPFTFWWFHFARGCHRANLGFLFLIKSGHPGYPRISSWRAWAVRWALLQARVTTKK